MYDLGPLWAEDMLSEALESLLNDLPAGTAVNAEMIAALLPPEVWEHIDETPKEVLFDLALEGSIEPPAEWWENENTTLDAGIVVKDTNH